MRTSYLDVFLTGLLAVLSVAMVIAKDNLEDKYLQLKKDYSELSEACIEKESL